jgi:hypothetical protein
MAQPWPISASDDELRQAVVQWSELLAKKRFAEALAMFEPSDDKYAQDWTPELLEATIANYGCSDPFPDGRVFAITSLYDLPDVNVDQYVQAHVEVDRENLYGLDPARYVGMIHYEFIPLNGEPSDLTATFTIKKVGQDQITLEFLDIHVM